ncbi:MAG: pullulanase [Calditrichae bacterium]|nr:pullulanase [Calditrichia bacterium]
MFDSTIVVADPYSRAVVTKNHYTHPAKTLIMEPDRFDWEGDTWQNIPHRDLIIYEMHVRDMTAHPSSGVPERVRGTYVGLIHEPQEGGLPYIGELDVNAVELLPAQDFGNIEPPFRDSTISVFNTWNPYSQNHWGYMTSYFFAPESYYATGSTLEPGQYNGEDGRQIREFKEMVKAFHQNNIAVLMDVVYNHVSQYDYNPLKYIDKFYYFRLTPNCDFENISGCGNDFKTERPMARRLIVESVKFWMEEYHIDGFRFDLANLIDWKTCTEILKEARKINPKVIIIAEPWGGGYNPPGFSDIGWAAWNDQIRNGYKGWNPHEDRGFVFGDWQNRNTRKSLQRYAMGSPRKFGGQYRDISHCVNYLASHDDHTLGDFIRLALREVEENQRITNLEANVRLSPQELKANKLAALALLTSQGMVMIHEGQEFARSKVIAKTAFPDSAWGHIDHNSYEKDNPTNWLNFRHVEINEELRQYYHNLIQLRKTYAAFRRADPGDFNFRQTADSLFLVYSLRYSDQHFQVALNGNPGKDHELALPIGKWEILADGKGVYDEKPGEVEDSRIMVPATSGVILKRIE